MKILKTEQKKRKRSIFINEMLVNGVFER